MIRLAMAAKKHQTEIVYFSKNSNEKTYERSITIPSHLTDAILEFNRENTVAIRYRNRERKGYWNGVSTL